MKRDNIIAALGTVLFHAMVVALLLLVWLLPPAADVDKDAERADEDGEILFGNEYVMVGDVDILAEDASANEPATSVTQESTEPAPAGADRADKGDAGAPSPTLSSKQPSPMKTEQRPVADKTGPQTKADDERRAAEKAAQERAEAISKRTNFAGTAPSDQPKGKTGSPDGNAEQGASAGQPGYYLLGRTVASWAYPQASATGTIVINVKVNREGRVVQASYGKGTGPVATNSAARQSCINAALGSRFSVLEDGPAEQSGTITYRFK